MFEKCFIVIIVQDLLDNTNTTVQYQVLYSAALLYTIAISACYFSITTKHYVWSITTKIKLLQCTNKNGNIIENFLFI